MEHWRTIRGDDHTFHFRPAEFEVLVSYPRPILEMQITKLKVKLDGAIHLRVISAGKTTATNELIFNYTVKRRFGVKKLPYPLWLGQRRMSPSKRKGKNSFFGF